MTRLIVQLSRYGLVAGLCASVNVAVMIGGEYAGLSYGLSVLLSYVLCVPIGYSLHTAYTFGSEGRRGGLFAYAFAMAMNLPLAFTTIWLFHSFFGLSMLISALLSTAVSLVYNFLSSRWATVRRRPILLGTPQ